MNKQDTSQNATPGASTNTTASSTSGRDTESPNGSDANSARHDMDGSDPATANTGDAVMDRIVQAAHETIDRLAGTAAPHVQRLQDQIDHVGETFNQQASDVRSTGQEWADGLRETVREHPLAAVATAVALGVLLTRLTR